MKAEYLLVRFEQPVALPDRPYKLLNNEKTNELFRRRCRTLSINGEAAPEEAQLRHDIENLTNRAPLPSSVERLDAEDFTVLQDGKQRVLFSGGRVLLNDPNQDSLPSYAVTTANPLVIGELQDGQFMATMIIVRRGHTGDGRTLATVGGPSDHIPSF